MSYQFYLCPAEKGRGFNIEWAIITGAIRTNELLFPSSYYYYNQFYHTDASDALPVRKVGEVKSPSKKSISPCFASAKGKRRTMFAREPQLPPMEHAV